ncbi:hypothetical protein [Oxalobacter formigenes]
MKPTSAATGFTAYRCKTDKTDIARRIDDKDAGQQKMKGKNMANNEFNWGKNMFYDGTGDGRRKRKKDPYENPLGLSSETPGMIRDTEETLRQSRETDNAIGEEAKRIARPVPVVKTPDPVIPPEPQTEIPPAQTDTVPQNRSVNTFGYGTKSVDTRPTEGEEKEKNYEDSLKIDGGNEGYTLPPIQPSTKNAESYPGEKEKLQKHTANEGFTIGHKSRTDEESERRIEETAAFLERFFKGNEKEQRFANGLSAPGEEHKSILGMYTDAKSRSDNAMQGDWSKTVKNLNGSSFGQGVMDTYHSAAAGGYDVVNGIARGIQMVEPFAKKHYQYPWKSNPRYTDPETKIEYEFDPMEYGLYRFRQQFRDESKKHEDARSEDFDQASLTNPGYLGVKVAGKGAQDIMALLGTAWVLKFLGAAGTVGEVALGALNGKGKRYDEHMDDVMKKSEEDMWKNGAYREMRKAGRTDHQARFSIGTKHARMESDAAAIFGAIQAVLTAGITKATRDGSEGRGTRMLQDMSLDKLIDYGTNQFENFSKDKNNSNN